ncbi:MAG: lipopolysaccharide/colanic/teichoic acid biosynthesis glycosyltransferase [Candidatus Poriferisodalaceae bacterium]|jgi:lipopolysaccharide/colanic/teichoic acid biosynthesis glycosyltransferase
MLQTAERPIVLPAQSYYSTVGKRALDIVGAGIVLVLTLPIVLVVAASLRLLLGPGILLRQERVGKHGEVFRCLKFRTMDNCRRQNDGDPPIEERRITHKALHDPRHTTVGRVIRKLSLDELPQLFNVLVGEMSLVGPRPEMAGLHDSWFYYHPRHMVRPGITGPFQVSPLREDGDLLNGLHLDEQYVEELSASGDLRLLVSTIGVVLRPTGS